MQLVNHRSRKGPQTKLNICPPSIRHFCMLSVMLSDRSEDTPLTGTLPRRGRFKYPSSPSLLKWSKQSKGKIHHPAGSLLLQKIKCQGSIWVFLIIFPWKFVMFFQESFLSLIRFNSRLLLLKCTVNVHFATMGLQYLLYVDDFQLYTHFAYKGL